jgi:hypothetical protein
MLIAKAVKEGLKIKNKEQPRQSNPRQQNTKEAQSQSQSHDLGL